jgi:hypothetical protein
MTQPAKSQEPSMDEILASVRRIIDDDDASKGVPEAPKAADDDAFYRLGLKLKFVYCMVGLFLGLTSILVGAWLCLRGVTGHSSWAVSMLGLSSNLNDASPGVIVFVVGVFIVLITRFQVRREKTYQVPKTDLLRMDKGLIRDEVRFAPDLEPVARPKNQRGAANPRAG